MFRFASPFWLLLLLIPLAVIIIDTVLKKRRSDATVLFSGISVFRAIGDESGPIKRMISMALMTASIISLILAMARPQTGRQFQFRSTYGIDIILTMDISTSMAAMDFDPLTRFEASKEVVKDFINNRSSDRIGLVVFAAQSFTLCPLTLDYQVLDDFLERGWESRLDDGTAIGSAIATSINRLRDSEAKSRVVILLTDGMNNRGNIDPLTAARMAEALGIRIYTIGVGTEGQAPMISNGRTVWTETHIDEETLRSVSEITGAQYYRATNKDELKGIYDEIGALETSKINFNEWISYADLYRDFLAVGCILLIASFLFDSFVFRRLP